jgi:hypothetical protein
LAEWLPNSRRSSRPTSKFSPLIRKLGIELAVGQSNELVEDPFLIVDGEKVGRMG